MIENKLKTPHKRLRRIYYVPGILTLTIAPILFFAETNKYIKDSSERCLRIIFPEKDPIEVNFLLDSTIAYQTYFLSGQDIRDSLVLILIENYARGLYLSKNDSIGIKVIINKEIKYKSYIDILNCCLKSGISDWIPYGDTLFIFNKEYPNDANRIFCQNTYVPEFLNYAVVDCCIGQKEIEPSFIQKIIFQKDNILRYLPLGILYLILVFSAIMKIKNEG
jgi:hypothetical protein